jgi:hypothetical protein
MSRFHKASEGQFFGSTGIDGNLYGIPVEQRQTRTMEWQGEIAKNVFPAANVTSYTDSIAGLKRVDSDRSFWTLSNGARNVTVTFQWCPKCYRNSIDH